MKWEDPGGMTSGSFSFLFVIIFNIILIIFEKDEN